MKKEGDGSKGGGMMEEKRGRGGVWSRERLRSTSSLTLRFSGWQGTY